jgi:hypothetical protein
MKKSIRIPKNKNNIKNKKSKKCSPMRTKPILWEKVKDIVKKSPKGGKPNTWSARKAQLAVAMYKKKGGGYRGEKKSCNSLTKWTREDWGYISATKKSGRYLPRKVREQLSPREKQTENRLKGTKKGVHIPYSKSVLKKMRKMK